MSCRRARRSENACEPQTPAPEDRQATPALAMAAGAAGWAEFLRNLALLFFGAPIVEPLLSAAPLDTSRAIVGLTIGVAIMVASSILDNERRD